jgi:Bacterial protein of unknown function (DUF937)
MATLLDSLSQAMGPDVLGQMGKAIGVDTNLMNKGLEVVGPLVTGALSAQASSANGLDGLMGMLPQPAAGESGVGSILNAVTRGNVAGALQSGIFGSGLSAITGTVSKAIGFNVAPLVNAAAPMVLGLVRQTATSQSLDKSGVAKLLQDEQSAFQRRGGQTVQLVQSALDAGKEAAAKKAKYSAELWTKLRLAPIAAARLVIGASPSGAMGTLKEVNALGDTIATARQDSTPTSIVSLALDGEVTEAEAQSLGEDKSALLEVVRQSVAAVTSRNPADATEYASFIVDVATRVAESSKEGGFLGIGGTRVSVEEQAAIDEIRTAVGLKARAAGA